MAADRLLIIEYLCSGLTNLDDVSPSMVREGRAMLLALLEDACRIDGLRVSTLWNSLLGPVPRLPLESITTMTPVDANGAWQREFKEVQAVYVIAPETGGILHTLCEEAATAGSRVLNCTPQAIEVAADKWETFLRLSAAGIPTIPTQKLEDFHSLRAIEPSRDGWVIKPRDGCGSEGIRRIKDISSNNELGTCEDLIIQPMLPGQAASVAALFDESGRLRYVFPAAIQHLSDEMKYAGGRIPAAPPHCSTTPDVNQLTNLLTKIGEAIPGLRGYVGCDLLIQPGGDCIVVEINPRLTTSYVGYRRLTDANIAERWLAPPARDPQPIQWLNRSVSFDSRGAFEIRCS